MVTSTQDHSNANNVIKFSDNSSAIIGFSNLSILTPVNSREASQVSIRKGVTKHIIFTAETHNFPTGVAPFQGATTGNIPNITLRKYYTLKILHFVNFSNQSKILSQEYSCLFVTFLTRHFDISITFL